MTLSPNVVATVVKGWSMIFPGKKEPEELAFISAKFCKSLSSAYNDHTFQIAAELVERETEFFPTIKAILDVRDNAYRLRKRAIESRDSALLPEETGITAEEEAENLEKLNIINKMLAGKLSISEAVKAQDEIKHYVAKR